MARTPTRKSASAVVAASQDDPFCPGVVNEGCSYRLSMIGKKICKMLDRPQAKVQEPCQWKDFDENNPDDQKRLVDWLEDQIFYGKTEVEIAKVLGVDARTVNALIANLVQQENLNRLFLVAQNLAKAQVLSQYGRIIPVLSNALVQAGKQKDYKLARDIAETMAKFADLRGPDAKSLLKNPIEHGRSSDPTIEQDFKFFKESFREKAGSSPPTSGPDREVESPPETGGISEGSQDLLFDPSDRQLRPPVLDIRPETETGQE